MKKTYYDLLLALLITIAIILFSQAIPLEQYLSTYPYYLGYLKRYPWYPLWRLAVLSFLYWLFSVMIYSAESNRTFLMVFFSSLLFTISHYSLLATIGILFNASFYPIFYIYRKVMYLDWGQLSIISILIVVILKIRKNAHKK
ncbi:MAG: hypothetical protein DRN04_03075 [Thermoprotei archaeon]|nr:MAG: hypothetical protein DRN04_03075 [Thermoprotei archaeon]